MFVNRVLLSNMNGIGHWHVIEKQVKFFNEKYLRVLALVAVGNAEVLMIH